MVSYVALFVCKQLFYTKLQSTNDTHTHEKKTDSRKLLSIFNGTELPLIKLATKATKNE